MGVERDTRQQCWKQVGPPVLFQHVVEGEQGENILHLLLPGAPISDVFVWFQRQIQSIVSIFPLLLSLFTHTHTHSLAQCMFLRYIFRSASFSRYMLLLFILFFIPGVMMVVAYGLISRELYRGMQFELGQNTESSGEIQQKSKSNINTFFSLHWLRWNARKQANALKSPPLYIQISLI